MYEKLPDLDEFPTVAQAEDIVRNADATDSWGAKTTLYVRNAINVLPVGNTVRQAFTARTTQRVDAAAQRVARATPIAAGTFPDTTYRGGAMTERNARDIIKRFLHHPLNILTSDYVCGAAERLSTSDPVRESWLAAVQQKIAAEQGVVDEGPGFIGDMGGMLP